MAIDAFENKFGIEKLQQIRERVVAEIKRRSPQITINLIHLRKQ